MSLTCVTLNCLTKLKLVPSYIVVCNQQRWSKIPKRKPRYLPMAQSKMFRINEHPYVPPDEIQLNDDLLEEYYRKFESIRKVFQEEIKQKPSLEEVILALKKEEEEEFKLLLEENRKENERIKKIKEETLEKEFQERQLQWIQMAEEKQQKFQETKVIIEEIVKAGKEKSKTFITLENIDQEIEKAIDNPVNLNFTINIDGTVKWEGKPSLEFERNILERVARGQGQMR